MESRIALFTTTASLIATVGVLLVGNQSSSHQTVDETTTCPARSTVLNNDATLLAPELRLTESVTLTIYEEDWIAAGKQMNVGWINVFGDSKYGSSYCDGLVHHIRNSPANVLQIASITDEGLATIRQLPRLRALVIFNSNVTDAGLRHLVDMPHLETVGLYYCNVTKEGVDRIRRQMPETHFEIHDSSKRGFVFDQSGCLATEFLQTYRKKSSWR